MKMGHRTFANSLCALMLLLSAPAWSATGSTTTFASPKWAIELKGGAYEPDVDNYRTYYGSDSNSYWALAGAYRWKNWLEVGAELAYSRDSGQGVLDDAGTPGGDVDYTLMPFTLFATFRYDQAPDQLFVPYAGLGIASAYYKQEIQSQSDRTGRSDIGISARAGVALSLDRLDPGAGGPMSKAGNQFKSYLFLEGQYFDTEVDSTNIGGTAYLLGIRIEFN